MSRFRVHQPVPLGRKPSRRFLEALRSIVAFHEGTYNGYRLRKDSVHLDVAVGEAKEFCSSAAPHGRSRT